MKNPSDAWEELRRKVLGLGDSSVRKTHYPSLRRRLAELERLRAELQQSEFYLAEGQRLADVGSWAFDPDGFYYWSPELFRMHGLDPASKPPSVQEYLDCVHAQDRESIASLIKEILAKASPFDATKRIVRPNGEVRYIRCTGAPAVENQGLKKYVGSAIDVTEHELLTQELRRREAYLAEAQRLSHTGSFGWKPDTGELIWSAETYRIFEYDRAVTPAIDLVAQRVHPEDRADFQSVIERASVGARDFEHAYRLLLPDGRVKHVHALAHATQDAYGNREFVGAVTDITEQRRAEESLRESESYLAEAQKLSHTGSWAWNPNPNNDIRYWSEECYRVLGFDPAGPLPRFEEFFQKIHPDDQAASRERFEKAIRDKADVEMDYRIVHPDKGVRDIHVVGHAVLDRSGDLHEFVGTVIDITERKRAEEDLRKSEAYLAEAQKLSHTGNWAWSPDTGNRYWSQECYRVLGFDPRDGLPRIEDVYQRIHPDDQVRNSEVHQRAISEKVDVVIDYRIVHPGGAVRDILSTCHPVLGAFGDLIEFTGTVIDVTERKRAEEELRASESKYRHLVDTTPAFVHTALPNGELDFLNRGWVEYVGAPLTDLLGWGWTSKIHPEDVEAFVDKWRASVRSGEPFLAESRVRRAGGEDGWLLDHTEPLRSELGEIIKWYGSSIDIQERKTAEEKIREQEAELRQILDLTPQHMGVSAPDGTRLYSNHTALEYFGVTLEQWLDPNAYIELVHPQDWTHLLG